MKLRLTAAILILAAATSVAAQPATAPFNPLVNVSNTSALRSDLADISMFGATTYVAWVEDNAAGQQIRLRRSNDGGASFTDGTSGRVIVTIDAAETVDSLGISATTAAVHSCDPASVITEEGMNLSRQGAATDLAGNSAQATVGGINLDKTALVITSGLDRDDTANDIQGFSVGTADTSALFQTVDATGRMATCTALVTVPHDQGGGKK